MRRDPSVCRWMTPTLITETDIAEVKKEPASSRENSGHCLQYERLIIYHESGNTDVRRPGCDDKLTPSGVSRTPDHAQCRSGADRMKIVQEECTGLPISRS